MDATVSFERVRDALGGWTAMARFFGVSDAALSQWRRAGFPAHRALEVEAKFKGRIRAADLVVTKPKRPKKKARAA